jgi:hypothetical protein
VCFCCSVFARVIVGLLVEAEAPELEHLWVFADDEPRAARHHWKTNDGNQSEPNKENRSRCLSRLIDTSQMGVNNSQTVDNQTRFFESPPEDRSKLSRCSRLRT